MKYHYCTLSVLVTARTARPRLPIAIRLLSGAVLGACAWPAIAAALPFLPLPLRFWTAWLLFTFGPGLAIGVRVTRGLDPLRRVIVVLGIGSAALPVLIDLLGRLGYLPVLPYVVGALAGAAVLQWRGGDKTILAPRSAWADVAACAALVALVAGLGATVFWHRYTADASGIVLYGDYDSADMSYYAAVASESTHTVPPTASYYSGHKLNAAYYPQIVMGMIHRFAGVPLMPIYYGLAWPSELALAALLLFSIVRSLASRGVAVLAVTLVLVGSDFSYLAAWFLPHAANDWDYLLWPTNFFAPTMQVLFFSTWTPSLVVFFAAIFAIVRGTQTRERGWLFVSALLIAILFEFKPFAYVVVMAALSAAAVFAGHDWATRRRFAATIGLGVLLTAPFWYDVSRLDPADRRTKLVFEFLMLPRRMLIKNDVTDVFWRAAGHVASAPALHRVVFLLMAAVPFFLVGIGVRWLGVAGVWRAIRRQAGADLASWSLLGWGVVTSVAIPCVLTTQPYVDTLQFYLPGLYLLWIFTAVALIGFAKTHARVGALAIVVAVALTLPSSLHYLAWKRSDMTRDPKAQLSRAELTIADYLRTRDPETTVLLHDRPTRPSLMTIMAERRIVLGWDVTYSAVGGEARLHDVDAFYTSATRDDPASAFDILRRYKVTDVLVRQREDRVHPDVLARLKVIMRFPEVTLYEVPEAREQGQSAGTGG